MKFWIFATVAILMIANGRADPLPPSLSPDQIAMGQIAIAIGMAAACKKELDPLALDAYITSRFGDRKFAAKESVGAAVAAVGSFVAFASNPDGSGPFNPKMMACAASEGMFGPDGRIIKGLIKP